jgi:hypothetical protein
MAIQVRRGSSAILVAVVTELNALRSTLAPSGTYVHLDTTSVTTGSFQYPTTTPAVVQAPVSVDLPSLLALCADLAARLGMHFFDAFAHHTPDGASALANGSPSALADALVFLNDAKAKWNAHLSRAGIHLTNDTANAITAPDAADEQTAQDLANTLRVVFATHIQNALPGAYVDLIDA